MYYYLKGTIAQTDGNIVVVDCSGVGYLCQTTKYTQASLKVGQEHKLYTHLNVREDAMDLFGFASLEEKTIFLQLISVSGVGPKAALAILSVSTPGDVALAIITEDEKVLTSAQGIGKKIAQRVILELKDKLAKGQFPTGGESYGGSGVTVIPQNKRSEAMAALAVLGYSASEINSALQGVDFEVNSLEQIIKLVLKQMLKQ